MTISRTRGQISMAEVGVSFFLYIDLFFLMWGNTTINIVLGEGKLIEHNKPKKEETNSNIHPAIYLFK